MSPPLRPVITAAVEGSVDEAVVRRLVEEVGGTLGTVYIKNGKAKLLQRLAAYRQAARVSPWVVVIDLDQDAECAPAAREQWFPDTERNMCFRIAVREVEAWLLADREGLASLLGVAVSRVAAEPEAEANPKQAMVNLARRSRRRAVREDMVPRAAGGRAVGPAYSSRLIEFVSTTWDPAAAAHRSDKPAPLPGVPAGAGARTGLGEG